MLACGGILSDRRFFSPRAVDWMITKLVEGRDLVLQMDTAYSAGFMKNPRKVARRRTIFGPSRDAFGHPGAGGTLAFADPENRLAFAYTMNQMQLGVLPNEKSLLILDALYGRD
jgi:CubicO group peptidase (beta-lactamase class C family)